MLYKEGKKWVNMIVSQSMEIGGIMFRPRGCQTYIVELSGNENEDRGSHK